MDRENEEEEEEQLNFNRRETATMKQIKKLLNAQVTDWNRIKNDQSSYLLNLAMQNIFSLWLLLLLHLMKLGIVMAEYIKYPVDIVLIVIFLYCLISIQYKQEDWRSPPFNFLLYMAHFFSRTLLAIYVIFKFPYLHLEIMFIMITLDYLIVYLCFQWDKRHKDQCFLAKDYWWRSVIVFLLQEILVNQVYDVYSWTEVFVWFAVYFIIMCYVLWECQMVRYRPYLSYYFNAFYLGQLHFDSDILFPCSIIKLYHN